MDKRTIDAAKECGKRTTCIGCLHDNEHSECLMRDTDMVTSALHVAETAEYYEAKIKAIKDFVALECIGSGFVYAEELLQKIDEIMEE